MQKTQKEFNISAQWSVLGTSVSIKRISKSLVEIVEGIFLEEAEQL